MVYRVVYLINPAKTIRMGNQAHTILRMSSGSECGPKVMYVISSQLEFISFKGNS